MARDNVQESKRELASLAEELAALRTQVGEMEQRLTRLEVREQLLESPAAAGDDPVKYG